MAGLPHRIMKETQRLLAEAVPGIKAEPDENNARYFHVMIHDDVAERGKTDEAQAIETARACTRLYAMNNI
ncbi:hypothetical protein GH733_003991 [Mirounga leonina]|nr:hypothetical protein GH733_001998 [Mirounga leonina]KAF3828202.1 hypothetical protein GH733_003991 [Mirounga leonina]